MKKTTKTTKNTQQELKNLRFDTLVAENKCFTYMQEIMNLEAIIVRQAKDISVLLEKITDFERDDDINAAILECDMND